MFTHLVRLYVSRIDMIKVMFVCLGNICRSPMAECVMSHMLKKRGLDDVISVASSANSDEEEGNEIYPPAQRKLRAEGVPVLNHRATVLTKEDGKNYDYIVCMEWRNVVNATRILGDNHNVCRLLDYSSNPRDIADPWWTGNFDITYDDIVEGCECLIEYIIQNDLN